MGQPGLAGLAEDGMVTLQAEAYLPREGSEAQLFYFARNLHDHIAAATANVLAEGERPFLDRSVHYDRLGPEAAARLEAEARKAAQRLLVEVNRRAMALAEEDEAQGMPDRRTRRVNLGVYLYAEDEPADAPRE